MDVLVVSPYVPHVDVRHAGGAFLLQHLLLLAEKGEVTVLVGTEADASAEAARTPDQLRLVLAPSSPPPWWSWARQVNRLARRVRPGQAGPTSVRALLDAGLVERARAADVVELHWPEYAVLATVLRRHGVRTPVSVIEHDVGVEASAGRLRLGSTARERCRYAVLRRERARQERRHLSAADLVLVFKDEDVDLVRRLGVRTSAMVLDPWLDTPSSDDVPVVPRSVLFTGALWREENARAVLWFLSEVWPHVVREVPDATFRIVGAGPTPALLDAAARVPGVSMVGEVPDLDPHYRSASVFVAPLLVPGGLKFKVPQAMLYGLPVVATTTAAAGVVEHAPDGTFWAVTDRADDMAAALVRALLDPTSAAAAGAAAATWCAERYSFARAHARVTARYASLTRQDVPCAAP